MLTLFPRIRPNPLPPPEPAKPASAEATSDAAPMSEQPSNIAPSGAPAQSIEPVDSTPVAEEVATQANGSSTPDEPASSPVASSEAANEHQFAPDSGVEPTSEILPPEPFIVEISSIGAAVEEEELPASIQFNPSAVAEVTPHSDAAASAPVPEDSAAVITEPTALSAESDLSEPPANAPSPGENAHLVEAAQDVVPTISRDVVSAHEASTELLISSANVFDEIEILHEAATETAPEVVTEPPNESNDSVQRSAPQASLEEVVEATHEANLKEANEQPAAEPGPAEPVPDALPLFAAEAQPIAPPAEQSSAEQFSAEQVDENALATPSLAQGSTEIVALEEHSTKESPTQSAAERESPTEVAAIEAASPEAALPAEALPVSEALAEVPAAETPAAAANPIQPVAETIEVAAGAPSKAPPPAQVLPPKPRRSKESFFQLERVPEPESMDHSGEVEAYASAAAQTHLDAIDDTFVAHAQLLLKGRERGRALDIGTGPGQILIKLGSRLTRWKFVGVDRSIAMIEKARQNLANTSEVAGRIEFLIADGNSLEFPDASFDLIVCNSVLHHLAEPQNLFSEIARVVKPGGAILLRDLCRPSRFGYRSHIRKNGKYYAGEMRRLYMASVQAAYTEEELQKMVAASRLRDVHVFLHGKTHIGVERALGNSPGHK